METADNEFMNETLADMDTSVKAGKPFFIWRNTTRMHVWTHLAPKYQAMIAEKGCRTARLHFFLAALVVLAVAVGNAVPYRISSLTLSASR